MDLFSDFCNICCQTNVGCLRNIAEDNMKHLKDTLVTFLGHADIINHNIINLCSMCCENLTRSNKFREMCFSNLIKLRQNVLDVISKLNDGTCAVQNTLQIFEHEAQRRKALEKNNNPVSISTKHFAGDCSNVSVISSVTECNESQVSFTKDSSECLKCDEDFELVEEFDWKKEIEISASDNFALKNVESESGRHVKLDVSIVKNNEGIGNGEIESIKEELHLKEEKSISGDIELETVNDEYGDCLNVGFEIANVRTIVMMQESGAKSITIAENAKDTMKLPIRDRKNVDTRNGVGDIENDTPAGKEDNDETCNRGEADVQRNGPHMCQHCHKQFPAPSKLITHMRTHTGDKPYKCTICDKSFTRTGHLQHERTHTKERPYKCNVCEKSFTQNSTLTTHQRIHTNTRPYKCTQCSKTFTQNGQLSSHMSVHTGQRSYKCSVCDKTFKQSSGLTIHMREHTGQRPYKCSVCDKAFKQSGTLTSHMCEHTGQRPYKCSVCDKAFIHSCSLTLHMRVHTGQQPYKCSVCDKAFTQSTSLTRHMCVHTGQRPYKCSVCDKTFTDNCNLTRHMRLHTGQRPYKCSVCDKTFTYNRNLTRHMREHTGQRPYKCSVCDKSFTQSCNLIAHTRTHGNTLTR